MDRFHALSTPTRREFTTAGASLAAAATSEDGPANGTSATMSIGISEPLGGWWGRCRVFRHLISGTWNGCPPCSGVFLPSARRLSEFDGFGALS